MKKLIYLGLGLSLFIPVRGFALVNDTKPLVRVYQTEAECRTILNENHLEYKKNATSGYYITCLKVTCDNNKIKHYDLAPIASNIKCINGNKNPNIQSRQNAAINDLENGVVCDLSTFEDDYGTEAFATRKYQFTCDATASGRVYKTSSTRKPHNPNNNDNISDNGNAGTVKNPQTNGVSIPVSLLVALGVAGVIFLIARKKGYFAQI